MLTPVVLVVLKKLYQVCQGGFTTNLKYLALIYTFYASMYCYHRSVRQGRDDNNAAIVKQTINGGIGHL